MPDHKPKLQVPTSSNDAALLCVGALADATPVFVAEEDVEEPWLLVDALAPFGAEPVLCEFGLNEIPG